jgi:hypothetical protein
VEGKEMSNGIPKYFVTDGGLVPNPAYKAPALENPDRYLVFTIPELYTVIKDIMARLETVEESDLALPVVSSGLDRQTVEGEEVNELQSKINYWLTQQKAGYYIGLEFDPVTGENSVIKCYGDTVHENIVIAREITPEQVVLVLRTILAWIRSS